MYFMRADYRKVGLWGVGEHPHDGPYDYRATTSQILTMTRSLDDDARLHTINPYDWRSIILCDTQLACPTVVLADWNSHALHKGGNTQEDWMICLLNLVEVCPIYWGEDEQTQSSGSHRSQSCPGGAFCPSSCIQVCKPTSSMRIVTCRAVVCHPCMNYSYQVHGHTHFLR